MARRRFSRRSRRKTKVVWFAPRTGVDGTDGPAYSCWADIDALLKPVGAADTAHTIVISPIVTNVEQAITPDLYPDAMNSHPMPERWTIQRIRGQILADCIQTQSPSLSWDGAILHAGIIRTQTVGDNLVIPVPHLNDSCLSDWLWMTHIHMSAGQLVCHDCPSTQTCCDNSNNSVVGSTGTAITGFQVFGRPNLIEIDVDVRVKRKVEPEHGIWLVMTAETAPTAVDRVDFTVRPMLRALLSRTV